MDVCRVSILNRWWEDTEGRGTKPVAYHRVPVNIPKRMQAQREAGGDEFSGSRWPVYLPISLCPEGMMMLYYKVGPEPSALSFDIVRVHCEVEIEDATEMEKDDAGVDTNNTIPCPCACNPRTNDGRDRHDAFHFEPWRFDCQHRGVGGWSDTM